MHDTPELFARVTGPSYEPDHEQVYKTILPILTDAGFITYHTNPFLDATKDELMDGLIEFPDDEDSLLRDADFVVIDATNEDITARYAIRLCRKFGRSRESTFIIKRGTDTRTPVADFSGFHFRNRTALAKKLRAHFGISRRLADRQIGYVFVFRATDVDFRIQEFEAAAAVFKTLERIEFTGRCEIYVREDWSESGRFYMLCVGLRAHSPKVHRTGAFWDLITSVPEELFDQDCGLAFVRSRSEFCYMEAIRRENREMVALEFEQGQITHVNKPQLRGDSYSGLAHALSRKRPKEEKGRA